jgi:hypothetical protein
LAAPIIHRVFTVGYVLTEKDTIGKMDMEKVKELGKCRLINERCPKRTFAWKIKIQTRYYLGKWKYSEMERW